MTVLLALWLALAGPCAEQARELHRRGDRCRRLPAREAKACHRAVRGAWARWGERCEIRAARAQM